MTTIWEAHGNRYRLTAPALGRGLVLLAFPDWHWCAEWSANAPPPSAEWLAEHGFSTSSADCEGAADGLAVLWPSITK